jgi:energy-converting hydrogenase Eha subunit E
MVTVVLRGVHYFLLEYNHHIALVAVVAFGAIGAIGAIGAVVVIVNIIIIKIQFL